MRLLPETYCILGLDGEALAKAELRTAQQECAEFFTALTLLNEW